VVDAEMMNPLDTLASEINELHEQIVGAMRTTVDLAIRCGEKLAQAKEAAGHGNWKPWLKANFDGSYNTAARYLRLHGGRDVLAAKSSTVETLGVREADELLAKANKEAKQAAQADDTLAAIDAAEADIASPDLGKVDAASGSPTPPVVESDAGRKVAKVAQRLETAQAIVGAAAVELQGMRDAAEGSEKAWLADLTGILFGANGRLVDFIESAMTGGDE
jgi:hypothetical protein